MINRGQQQQALDVLPTDVLLIILRYLRVRELTSSRLVYKRLSKAAEHNDLWIDLYKADFGPLTLIDEDYPSTRKESMKNAKLQYIAAYLYKRASECKRPDIAQIYFIQFKSFLKKHRDMAWTTYYFGVLYYHGEGIKTDEDKGFSLLLTAFDNNDYRAAIKFASLLINSFNRNFLQTEISEERLKLIIPCLMHAYLNGIKSVALDLAFLYEHGIGVKSDLPNSIKWCYHALDANNPSAITNLLALDPDIHIASEVEVEVEGDDIEIAGLVKRIFKLLDSLETIYLNSDTIVTEINALRGAQYSEIDNHPLGHKFLIKAANSNHVNANRILGCQSLAMADHFKDKKIEHLDNAIRYFTIGFNANDEESTSKLYKCLKKKNKLTDTGINIEIFKKAFCNGNVAASKVLAEYFLQYTSFSDFMSEPKIIWWIQLAAQSGDTGSYNVMLKALSTQLKEDHLAYIYCALGIIHTYGILHSDTLAADPDQARIYFSKANELDSNSIQKYLNAGIESDLVCSEVSSLLKEQIQTLPAHNLKRSHA